MGYSKEWFLKSVDPNLICGICSDVLESPVLTPCGHSYCTHCLRTWLSRPRANTCPECRTWLDNESSKPILSLRNLIQAMDVKCVYACRGCDVVMRLEKQQTHLLSCKFVPVACAGCQIEVSTSELADHQMDCAAIRSVLEADDNLNNETGHSEENIRLLSTETSCTLHQNRNLMASSSVSGTASVINSETHVKKLLTRIGSLENEVGRLLVNLKESQTRNTQLCLQYRRAQHELEDQLQRNGFRNAYCNKQAYTYGYDPPEYNVSNQKDIGKLSLVIARHLLDKPRHIDSNLVFQAIHNCYVSHFSGLQPEGNHDIHMLLATAYASNWFTSSQKIKLECWLQCVLQCQVLQSSCTVLRYSLDDLREEIEALMELSMCNEDSP